MAADTRKCASCGGRCYWADTAWTCRHCGDEWDEAHGLEYAAPGDWTPGSEEWKRNPWAKAFTGVITSPWPPESGRVGNRRKVCPHWHRTRVAALVCATDAVRRGGWP